MHDVAVVLVLAAKALVRERFMAVERACEEGLASGKHGVSIVEDIRNPMEFDVRVDPFVPYGQIYQFPNRAAYSIWIMNGAPQ